MRLSEWEEWELSRVARALERDDPRLAQQLRTMTVEPAASLTVASFVLVSSLIGFLLIGVGLDLGLTGCAVFGVVFATCVPVGGSVWLTTRQPDGRT